LSSTANGQKYAGKNTWKSLKKIRKINKKWLNYAQLEIAFLDSAFITG
jgi:hypothetical protein